MKNVLKYILGGLLVGTIAVAATNRVWESQEWLSGQITTPSNPSAGKFKFYFKSDGEMYKLNSAGVEEQVGGGGSADEVTFASSGTLVASNVQDALEELDSDIVAHLGDATDAHDASAISNVGAGGISSTDVQAAINELDTEKAPKLDPTLNGNVTIASLTASRAVVSDGSSVLTSSATTATELGYVNGVTRAIQTQLNEKAEGRNILLNPNFELSTNWTASGGATTAINSTAVGTGTQGYDWDSNSSSQTLSSDSVTIPNGMKGRNGVVSCAIKTVSGAATHTIQAYDGTNIVGSSTINSDTNSFARTALNFVFPSSGSIVLRLVSVASNEPEIYIDDCYMGLAEGFNIGSVSQATLVGTLKYASTANCLWQSTATTMTAIAADTDCPTPTVTGSVTAPGTKVPGFVVTAPGNYLVLVGGAFWATSSTSNGSFSVKLSDGTISSTTQYYPVISTTANSERASAAGSFTFSKTTAGPSTMQFYVDMANSTLSLYNDTTGQEESGLTFSVYRYPTSEETVYRPEVQNVWGSTYWPDGTSSFTTTSASYTAVTAASMLGTAVRTGRAVACADTNAICIEIPSMPAGSYKVEYSGGIIGDSGTSCAISAYDGTTDYEMSGTNGGGTIIGHTVITYSSQQTDKEFTIRIKRTSGVNNCQVATSLALGHNITITPLSQNIPAPVLVDRESVSIQHQETSGTSGGTFTSGSYQTRTLNTLQNPGNATWVTGPTSNQFTLQPGTYRVTGWATAKDVNTHKLRLRNITDSSDTIIGLSTISNATAGSMDAAHIQGVFTITAQKTFELQHRCQTTRATDGFGSAATYGDVEVYANLLIEKFR